MSEQARRREPIQLQSIRIGRAPGIDGAFTLTGLGPGITVIHGPNGSGKSTTARAIHSLLWPDPPDDACLIEATISYTGRRWAIRRDGRSVRCQRDSIEHPPLTFDHLTPETRDRYHLALHDLLRADDEQFAALVTREASGGYDLEAAAARLRLTASPPRPSQKPYGEAVSAYRQAVQKQQELANQEAALAALEVESERAAQARIAIMRLNAIAEALAAQADLCEAIDRFHARFDTGIAHVTAGHAGTLADWREQEPRLRRRLAEIESIVLREQERQDETGLPASGECARVIRILEAQYTELCEAEAARRKADIALESARQHLIALHAQIAPALPTSLHTRQALALMRDYHEALSRLEEAERIGAAEHQLAAWVPRPNHAPEPERLQEALRILAAWLQTPPPALAPPGFERARLVALFAALLVIVQGLLLGMTWHPAGYGLATIGLGIGLLALVGTREAPALDARIAVQEEYGRLGLPGPDAWTAGAVTDHFLQTLRAYIQERTAQQAALLWRSISPHLEARDRALAEAQAQKDDLETRIGADVRLDRPALATLTTSLETWLKTSHESAQLERNRALLLDAEQAGLDAFNRTANSLGSDPATSAAEARAVLGETQDRHDRLKQAQRAIEQATAERDTQVLPTLRRIEAERAALIERYGGRSLPEIEGLAAQFDAYREQIQVIRNRRDQVRFHQARLAADVNLAEWTPERVQLALAEQQTIEQQATEVNQKIGAIRNAIQTAKSREDVAAALASVKQAKDDLRERRDEHFHNLVGRLVLEQARRETREANLPAVALRARELFAAITRGRYQLNFNPGPPPSFTATDTTTGAEHPLDELSSGTRVQLLIAVRTAFVEQNEPDAALPMIFDETLANADAARAEALIETTIKLAAGRQVIYFTAQLDEVEKWRQLGAHHQTEITVIDLAEARRLEAVHRPAQIDLPALERPLVPAPNGHSREVYRRLLGAPPLNLWSVDGGDIHLWHLTDDLDELHQLAVRNITVWGQVRQLTVDGASPALGIDRERLRGLAARVGACRALIDAARVGRGRPVTSQHLHASGGLTPRFTEECLRLLEQCNGDGRQFIERLECGDISGLRTKNIAKFRDYFETNGHLVTEQPLPPVEMRLQVLKRLGDELAAGLIDIATIDRIISEGFAAPQDADQSNAVDAPVLSGPD